MTRPSLGSPESLSALFSDRYENLGSLRGVQSTTNGAHIDAVRPNNKDILEATALDVEALQDQPELC
jgi:hypothetical protein